MKINTLICCAIITTIYSCQKYYQPNLKNQTTKINTQNVDLNINIPQYQNNTQIILAKILANATTNTIQKPTLDSIRKYYARNNNETIQITTAWKTNHNQYFISSAVNTTATKNNQPIPNKIYTQTTFNNKILNIEHVVDLKNKKELFRNIIIDKFLSDNDITRKSTPATTLIKPLDKFPISNEFILAEKNLTLIYNPQTLTFDNKITLIEIPYDQLNNLLIINPRNIENLTTTEFNEPLP